MRNNRLKNFKRLSFFNTVKPQALENEILIYGPIVDVAFFEDEVTTKSVLEQLDKIKSSEEISVRINSPGGFAFEGIAIYNALVRHPAKVTVSIDGLAASAASIVAMAGDKILMNDNGTMMIHDPFAMVIGNADDLLKEAEVLDKIAFGMVNTYSLRTGIAENEIRQMMKDETWFTAEEALDKGFIDEVVKSKGKPKTHADLSIYNRVPDWVKEQYEVEQPPTSKTEEKEKDLQNEKNMLKFYFKNKKLELEELEI